jgi:hypothetical protein
MIGNGTAFSDWMLDRPFLGYLEEGRILAAAGTMTASSAQRWSLIGNFSHPSRGRGLGRRVGAALIAALYDSGTRRLSLTAVAGNGPGNGSMRAWVSPFGTVGFCWKFIL